jgi:Flp pilus assembly protein TadG
MTRISHFARQARASVAVEFALISVLFLLPLLAGALDFVIVFAAQAQLNTALQSLYYFGITTPASATNSTIAGYVVSTINSANGASGTKVTLPATTTMPIMLGSTTIPTGTANPSTYYGCYSSATSITYQSTTCTSGTQQTYVIYQVSGTVTLPMPLPGRGGTSLTLTAGGAVQTGS